MHGCGSFSRFHLYLYYLDVAGTVVRKIFKALGMLTVHVQAERAEVAPNAVNVDVERYKCSDLAKISFQG